MQINLKIDGNVIQNKVLRKYSTPLHCADLFIIPQVFLKKEIGYLYQPMIGDFGNSLFSPWTDHAGVSTPRLSLD